MGVVLYLPFCVAANGYSLFQQYSLAAVFFQDCVLIGAITILFEYILKVQSWISGDNEDLPDRITEKDQLLERCDLCIKVTLNGIHYQGICLMA